MKTSLNHLMHRTRLEQFSEDISNVKDGKFMARQQIGTIGRSVREEITRFTDECRQTLGKTADFLHSLRDYTTEQKPGVSEKDNDLFATLAIQENIASSVNERWNAVTDYTGNTTRPTVNIQTTRPPDTVTFSA